MAFRNLILLIVTCTCVMACKPNKKILLSGEEPVEISEFIDFFKPVTLPFFYADTSLPKKESDSLLISRTNFLLFIPDSVLVQSVGKSKPKIYGIGKAEDPNGEKYLFIKVSAGDRRAFLIIAFDRQEKFLAAITALKPDNNRSTVQSVSMDRRFTISKSVQLRNADGSTNEGKDVFVLNAGAKAFTLIMTDALSDKSELINPIDTLPRKQKWSADYTNGKSNLVSIRDGRRGNQIRFFIHFDKSNGTCSGELKGEALIKNSNTAEYREEGDPCVLKFIFSPTSVSLQEVEGCGSRRPLNCSLNGSYARKKNPKPAAQPKK